jgi:membrane fusion protein (multidrug efflux system)
MQDVPSTISREETSRGGTEHGRRAAQVPYLRQWSVVLGFLGVIVIAGIAYGYCRYVIVYPSTDNAYVQANIAQIAPVISGIVSEVNVSSYAQVKSGDVLLRIDPSRFEAELKAAQERLALVQQQSKAAEAQPAAQTNIHEAQAAVDRARLELEEASIKAPVDGIVGKVLIRPGTMAKTGVGLFPIVDTSTWWVDANFKETDLARIHSGQKAKVHIDLFPSQEWDGTVEAISPVSSSALSLLPPDNASGNWIKLTQRFPVKVSLSLRANDPPMHVGASATVTVDTSETSTNSGSR